MAKLKLLSTIFSKLASLTKNNGQIIVTRDSKSLYIDLEGERIEITDWVDVDTEESLLVILSPLINKYYYTKDTNKIWRYISGEWKCLNAITPTYGVATSSALGLVKSGTDITVDSSGNVSVNDDSHNHVISNVDGLQDALDGKSATGHIHDSRYYTEAEVNSLLLSKQDSSTAITTSNIASQSVNYAKSAGSAVDQTARNAAATAKNAAATAQNTANSKVGTISNDPWYSVTTIATFRDSSNAILNGGKGNYAFSISAWSDKRLKTNVKNSSIPALDKINKVQYREFDFVDEKFGTHQDIGYIADELKEVFPECVISVPQDKEKCGYEELYQVQDTSMIKYLGKAIQELYSIIESQQKEIDELKKRINAN